MPWIVEDKSGVSMLVEYLILMGILAIFTVIMSLQLHETLTESQISRVMENQFADVASQISAIYTDFILLMPSEGQIETRISMQPEIGERQYNSKLDIYKNVGYVSISSGNIKSYIGLGYKKFIGTRGVIDLTLAGDIISSKVEGEEKPKVIYKKEEACPFIPKVRLKFNPSSVEFENFTKMIVSFENPNEITDAINWEVTLWNGSKISGASLVYDAQIRLTDITGCSKQSNPNDYMCIAAARSWIADRVNCSSSVNQTILVSTMPEESNPYLVYEKWVEPSIVKRGEKFELRLKLEGKGFFVEGATNLSVVHIVDVSGSMLWPTIFKNHSFTVNPNVLREEINLAQSGRLEIYVYTIDRLQGWYNSNLCKCSGGCPNGYASSLIRLYLNGNEVGSDYSSGSAIGKSYITNNAQAGNYTIEVVASAPEQINITIRVVHRNNEILNKTIPYLNRQEASLELPSGVSYKFLAISGIQNLPNWDMGYSRNAPQWSDWIRIESYSVGGSTRYWDYSYRLCGDRTNTFQQGSLNVWLIYPNGSKEFLMKGENQPWYQARNNYGTNGINADAFIPNPATGEYRLLISPITKSPTTFTATALIKRIDAAKLAGITFNSMLGGKDFVGLTTFTTDAERIAVNSSPLRYMTNDKGVVNSQINQLRALSATDHADGLYFGSQIFPIWNENGNNCTECIKGTRPLIIMLTDGEPTICNVGAVYYYCNLCNQQCSGGSWCEACKNQALCIGNHLKNNVKINDFNVSICTIGFSTDIGGQGQTFLRQLASPRPDTGEPCYFFATTSEELVEAYRTIFNAFQIAAKQIIVHETLNVSMVSPFEFLGVTAKSSKGSPVGINVERRTDKTVITLDISSIQKDEVIELIVSLKAKDDATVGEYDVNIDSESFIEYTALDNRGNEVGRINVPIISNKDRIKITTGDQPEIIIR